MKQAAYRPKPPIRPPVFSTHVQARVKRETVKVIQDIAEMTGLSKCEVVRECIEAGVGRIAARHADHLIRASKDADDE